MSADAIFLPQRETVRDSVNAALAVPHRPECRLYTDGRRVAWLPRALPGWFKLAAVEVRDAYQQTDASASCCDLGAAA